MFKNQKGSAAIMAVVTMLFLTILAGAASTLVNGDLRFSKMNSDAIEAQFAAEAGAKRAISMFHQATQSWTWLDQTVGAENWINLANDGSKQYHVRTVLSGTQVVPAAPAAGGTYTITSTGRVNGTTRTVSVVVTVTAGTSDSVFSKYALYSQNDTYIWGGNGPNIQGDMGLAGGSNVKIESGYNFLKGKLYVKSIPTGWHDWLTNSMYVIDPDIGSLPVIIPAMPIMPAIPTSIPNGAATVTGPGTINQSVYYSTALSDFGGNLIASASDTTINVTNGLHLTKKGSYSNGTITASNGNLKLYINGSANLSNGSFIKATGNIDIYISGSLSLSGGSYIKSDNGNVTIIANQDINLTDNNNYIQAATSGELKMYSLQKSISLSQSCYVNGGTVTMQAQSNVNFANSSSVNKSSAYSNAIAYIYASGSTFTNDVVIGGAASQVTTTGPFDINNNVYAPNTLFISASGQTKISGSPTIGGMYTNGSLSISGSPTILHNTTAINLVTGGSSGGSGASPGVAIGSWSK